MKQMIRRWGALILSFVLCIAGLMITKPTNVYAITQSEFDQKLNSLRSEYPNYSVWDGSFDGGTQCYGFAHMIGNSVFGSRPATWTKVYNMNNVKAGDLIQYGNTSGYGHTVFVTSVSGNTITFLDCNGNGNYSGATKVRSCGIKWDNKVQKNAKVFNLYSFSYVLSSPGINGSSSGSTDTCDCSTSYAGTYKVSTSGYTLTIRTGHGTSYGVAGSMPDGATVTVSKGNGSWAHVSYNGISGYCSMEYLTKINTDTEAPVVSNVESEVANLSSLGYIVHCNVSDNVGVTKIEFHVAHEGDDQWKQYSGNIGDNYAWVYIPLSDFGYRLGTYWTHIYAYDAAGNFDRNVSLGPVYINGTALATQEKETVKEGTYCLKNANGSWMDVNGAEDKNGAEVVIPNVFNGGGNQQFKVVYLGNGKYHLIAAFASGSRVLDINRGNSYSDPLQSGCKVDIWQTNDAEAQEFYLTPWGDGSYAIELASKDNYVIGGRHVAVGVGYYLQQAVKEAPSQHWYFCNSSGNVVDVTPETKCTGVSLNYSDSELLVGTTLQLTATVSPSNASNKTLEWSSSDTGVATVNASGLVTAVGAGNATITAKAQDGSNVSASCQFTVECATHSYKEEVTKKPTCTEAGVKTFTCTVCGASKTESIPATGHQHTEIRNAKEATTDQDGYTGDTYCKDCNTKLSTGESIPKQKKGWVRENQKWYYYTQGKKATGWTVVGNVWYYFNKEGQMQTGWLKDGKSWYYLQPSGSMTKGWATIEKNRYYFNTSGVMQTNSWQKDGKKSYYLKADGSMAKSWTYIGKSWYYFGTDGVMATGWTKIGNNWYYLKANGVMATGWLQEGKNWYYLKAGGGMTTGWAQIGNSRYYFNASGVMQTNQWLTLNNKKYYLKSGGVAAVGWTQIGKNWYYFGTDGVMATGWTKIGSSWYYLKSDGTMATGWLQEGKNWYYLKAGGGMTTGWAQIGNSRYYFNASGVMQVNQWLTLNNKKYYITSGGAATVGWSKIGGSWYYFGANGAMATGWTKVGSSWYYLNANGVMATGWMKVGNSWYYLNGRGVMLTGWQKIGNSWYYMNSSGVMVTGDQVIDGRNYHFNTSGVWIG